MNSGPTTGRECQNRGSGPFYSFKFRNFRIFFYGQLVSVAGSWMQMVAQSWLVYDLTHRPSWLGIVAGASAIPYVMFSMRGGLAADRHPRRTILLRTQACSMALSLALAVLASNLWIPIQPWHIAAIAGLAGIVNAYTMPAQQALVAELVEDPKALGNAIALSSLRFNFARFLGPMLAGIVLVNYGAEVCFLLNAASFMAVIASLWMLRLPPREPVSGRLQIREGFAYLLGNHRALRIVVLVASGSLFGWSVSTLFPVFAARLGHGAAGYSTIVSVNGIGAALGGLAMAFAAGRFESRLRVYGGAFMFSAALIALSVSTRFEALLTCVLVSGFSMIVFAISANTRVQEEVPGELRGRVMAIYSLVFQGVMPVGGLLAGLLAERFGAPVAVRINACLCLLTAGAMYAWSVAESRRAHLVPERDLDASP